MTEAAPPTVVPGSGFEQGRSRVGLLAGPLVFAAIALWPGFDVPRDAQTLGAILGLMIVFWVTEALPLAATALLGPTLAVLLGVTTARTAFAAFADPIIFFFIGSFITASCSTSSATSSSS